MITNAVFILGAGASCPYGFPSGRELRKKILTEYVSDYEKYLKAKGAIEPGMSEEHQPEELHMAKKFVERFRKSTTGSIDLYLARNPEFNELGKRAIIFRILAAENASGFRERTKIRDQDWYTWLFEQMTDELVKKEDFLRFSENDVSFITFNYDRSLEHFLYDSLFNSFHGLAVEEIIKQIRQIEICHVFGQVGPLEWQAQHSTIEYRINVGCTNVGDLADNIRIVYEEGENHELERARKIISRAQRVFFLGFGYAQENLEALKIPEVLADVPRVVGTALGLTKKETATIKSQLSEGGDGRSVVIQNQDCLSLLRTYM